MLRHVSNNALCVFSFALINVSFTHPADMTAAIIFTAHLPVSVNATELGQWAREP